ncbi:MAG: LamG-like jellyroll fold domain-containing protein [Vicinamibacteria bacterium]
MPRSREYLFVIALVALACAPLTGSATAYLNKPIGEHDSPQINSWVDHTEPTFATSTTMTRFDGQQWTDGSGLIGNCTLGVNCYDGHNGIDYSTGGREGYLVLAAAAGTVKRMGLQNPSDPEDGYGYYVRLWHSGQGDSTIYAHLAEDSPVQFNVATSTVVSQGQRVALSGATGEGSAHLHFGVIAEDSADPNKSIDPYGWSGSGSDPWTLDQGNLWSNASSVPVTADSINPSSVTNYTSVAIASVAGVNYRLGWDKESNLVGNWRMDEPSGTTVADASGNSNNGTATGAAATSTAKLTNARYFDGSDDYVEIPDSSSISPTGDFSISTWFRRGDTGREQDFFSKYNSNTSQSSFRLVILGDNRLHFKVCQDGTCSTQRSVETSVTTTDAVWYHVVGVFKSGASADAKIYLNGVDVSTNKAGTATSALDSSAPVMLSSVINSVGSRVNYFKGYLDEARLYNRALYPSEVMELYKVTGKGKVELTKSGQSNIACSGFTLTDYRNLNNGSCPVGGAATGTWNVVMTNPDGTSGTLSSGLTINSSAPTVTSISPSSGSGSVSIASVGGTNFLVGWDKESGLLGNWRLDESSGATASDSSGNGYTGNASGTTVVAGTLGNARSFVTGDSVNFGDVADLNQTGAATISFWWKGTPTTDRVLLWKEEPSGQYRGYSVFQYNFGNGIKLNWRIGQNDVGGKRTYCATTTSLPSDGLWHHYVITQTGGTSCANNISIYFDGIKEQALTQYDSGAGDSLNSTASLYMGNGSGYAGPSAAGILDELRIYNRTLSNDEVMALDSVAGSGSVKLTKTGQPDIICPGFTWSSAISMTSGTCNVTGAATGAWNVQLTSPNNTSGTLTNGFAVQ